MNAYIALTAAIVLGVIGQIGLKFASSEAPRFWLVARLFNEYFAGAVIVYFLSVILYTYSLKTLPLSVAFPSVSVSYVAVAWLSHLIWQTPFGWREAAALLLILGGIALLFSSQ